MLLQEMIFSEKYKGSSEVIAQLHDKPFRYI